MWQVFSPSARVRTTLDAFDLKEYFFLISYSFFVTGISEWFEFPSLLSDVRQDSACRKTPGRRFMFEVAASTLLACFRRPARRRLQSSLGPRADG